jgi:hypothetical protein
MHIDRIEYLGLHDSNGDWSLLECINIGKSVIRDDFSSRINHDFLCDHWMDAIESGEDKGRDIFWGGSDMIWAGISLEAKSELFILQERTLNANNYTNNILADYVVPFAPFVVPEFLLRLLPSNKSLG